MAVSGVRVERVGLVCVLATLGFAACSEPLERNCERAEGVPAFAVVLSDFQSTSIGLLDADGRTLTECWIDSGTQGAGLVAALSGDVVLASDQTAGSLTVIDRFGTDVYSRVSLSEPTVLGQVRLQDPAISGAFSSNPHDAVVVDDSSVWVSRYGASEVPSAPPLGRGSDLLEIDPVRFERTGRRISLESLVEPALVETDQGPVERLVYPRPSRIVRVADRLVVGLDGLTLRFDGAGSGSIAVVDVEADVIRRHRLPGGVSNCGRVVPVPNAPDLVAVGCIGFSRPFGDVTQVRSSSGVFMLRVTSSTVTVVQAFRPQDRPSAPAAVAEIVSLDASTVAAVAYDTDADRYYVVDLASGQAELLFTSARRFEIGLGAFEPDRGLLLVPDAGAGLRRFVRERGGGWRSLDVVPLDGGGVGLPPRSIQALR